MDDPITQSGITVGFIGVLYALYRVFKHVRLKSKCCGKDMEGSLDLTPVEAPRPPEAFTVVAPPADKT